jgi:hypothetical protein
MSYSGQAFPSLQYGNRWNLTKASSDLPVSVVGNGQVEYRTLRASYPRRSWQIPARALVYQDLQTLAEFWNQMGGTFQSFRFVDPEYNQLTDYQIGVGAQLTAPSAPVLTQSAGALPAGTYAYEITALNAYGETTPSAATDITLSAAGGVGISWAAVPGATSYNIYRGGQLLGNTVSLGYADGGAATSSVAPPAVNGSGLLQFALLVPVAGLQHPLYHIDGLTVSVAGATVQIINGMPYLVYPAGAAPAYGQAVTLTGTFALAARFDSSVGYALANAVNPGASVAQVDALKIIEVFE